MPMNHNDFLNAIIDDGLEEVRQTYLRVDQHTKRDGAVAGFESCRGLSDEALLQLRERARGEAETARKSKVHSYWFFRMKELQIEWVLNVLSAALYSQGEPVLIPPTGRGLRKAADILGGCRLEGHPIPKAPRTRGFFCIQIHVQPLMWTKYSFNQHIQKSPPDPNDLEGERFAFVT